MFRLPLALLLCYATGLLNRPVIANEFMALPTLPGTTEMRAYGVSSDGDTIVGLFHAGSTARGFRWHVDDLQPTLLDDLAGGAVNNEAVAVSDIGSIAVGRGESVLGIEAARWPAAGPVQGLGDLADGFLSSQASGISANGSIIVGTGHSAMGREAFRWSAATGMIGLGHLPFGIASEASDVSADGNVVVGTSETFDAILGEAFRWTNTDGMVALGDLEGGDIMSQAMAVSADGSTVVGVASSSNGMEAFQWTAGGGMQGLGDLAGGEFQSIAYDVSADGRRVVGAGTTDSASTVALLWTIDSGMQSLADILANDFGLADELAGWDLLAAHAISGNGQVIVGTGIDPTGQVRAWRAVLDTVAPRSGDYNGDAQLDVADIELLQEAMRIGSGDDAFDLNSDGVVDRGDLDVWIRDIMGTYYGDANLDGTFGTEDLVRVFMAGEYEDGRFANSTWSTGDWDGDQEFGSSDIILAFQDGGYERGPRAAVNAVPEPAPRMVLVIAAAVSAMTTRRRRHP
jgi:probable HAF family extracellular repeat protein